MANMSQHCGVEQLDATILNELLDRIEVGQKQTGPNGIKTQTIRIRYRFAGIIEEEEQAEMMPAVDR